MDPPAPAEDAPGPSGAAQPLNKQMQQRTTLMPPPKQPSGLPGRGLANPGGRPRKDWVRDQLGESNDCKHCHKVLSKNITYTAAHLLSCAMFLVGGLWPPAARPATGGHIHALYLPPRGRR